MTLHVTATALAEVLIISVVKHIYAETHRIHVWMHEVFTDAHQTALLLLGDFHEMLCCFPKYFIKILLLLIEASLYFLIELFEKFLLFGLDFWTDCSIIWPRINALCLH